MAAQLKWPFIGKVAMVVVGASGAASAAYYRYLSDARPSQPDAAHGWAVRMAAHGQVFYVTVAESWLSRAWIAILPLAIPCVLLGFVIAARSSRAR